MQDEEFKNIQALFEQRAESLPEEPFAGHTLKLIKRQRFRQLAKERLPWVIAVLCCVLLSPYLIRGSILLSNGLERLFETTGNYFATPVGMVIAALFALTFLILNRRLVF